VVATGVGSAADVVLDRILDERELSRGQLFGGERTVASITSYTVTSLARNATYYFEVIAYAGSNSATSNVQSFATLPAAAPSCKLGN